MFLLHFKTLYSSIDQMNFTLKDQCEKILPMKHNFSRRIISLVLEQNKNAASAARSMI